MKSIGSKVLATVLGTLLLAGAAFAQQKELKVGFFPGPYADQFRRGVQPVLEKRGIKVTMTEFSNAIQPNTAVMDGSLDVNIFQNKAFMDLFNSNNKGTVAEILRIPSAPLGMYSSKIKSLAEIKDGMRVSLPNDPANMGRSLMFMESLKLIKVDPAAAPGRATEKNVVDNPRKLVFVPLDAPQIPRALPDVDVAIALGNHILAAGMLLSQSFALEDPAPQYQIIISARADKVNTDAIKELVAAYKSNDFRSFVEKDPKTVGFSKPDYWR